MAVRGIRGATTADSNTSDEVIAKTKELLLSLVRHNHLDVEDIASVIFSVTNDLDAEFPAVAGRELGWAHTPLFCTMEMEVPQSLPCCIRVLLHVNSEKRQDDMVHVYLHGAKKLRPDLESIYRE
ncbi:MAG: chorismate mutase [Spirochaetes bacterium RBG_16_49_21]|nr:MAG: chorismate mutase [Spirochaetes bacterium RBG_16_49_21]